MSPTYRPSEPCAWCGWVRGEHASACQLNAYVSGAHACLPWPPGRNEPPAVRESQPGEREPAWRDASVKLDCPE